MFGEDGPPRLAGSETTRTASFHAR